MKRNNVFATEIFLCARKYSIIDNENTVVVPKVIIPFMTKEGYFSAPFPAGVSYDEFRQYENYELYELAFPLNKDEDTFVAGKIEKVTATGFCGRFYKDCIHRAEEERDFCYTIRSAKWIEMTESKLWAFKWRSVPSIYKCEITSLPDKSKCFSVAHNEDEPNELIGSIIFSNLYIVGVVIGATSANTLQCISAEVLLREMCQHKEDIEKAIAEGRLPEEPDPEFIIHNGVLEKYQGNAEIVIIPDDVHIIGKNAFRDNYTIKELYLPKTVIRIEASAFDSCLLLNKVHFNVGLRVIGSNAFCLCRCLESAELPSSVFKIERGAFAYCEKLTTLQLPENLELIEPDTFSNCSSLTSVAIPVSVKRIDEYAFQFCKKLSEVHMSNSVKTDEWAFDETKWQKKRLKKSH